MARWARLPLASVSPERQASEREEFFGNCHAERPWRWKEEMITAAVQTEYQPDSGFPKADLPLHNSDSSHRLISKSAKTVLSTTRISEAVGTGVPYTARRLTIIFGKDFRRILRRIGCRRCSENDVGSLRTPLKTCVLRALAFGS